MTPEDGELAPSRARRAGRRPLSTLDGAEAAWVTNRDRVRAPKGGMLWCGRCDRNLVSVNTRCGVCGLLARQCLKRDPHA